LSVFAALLGTEQVSAQTICLQVASLAFMVPLGLGIASCSLVGNAIGAGKRSLAINIAHLAIGLIVFLDICVGLVVTFAGGAYFRIFTADADGMLL
jgi:MATE family multidrug resistance protein